MLQPKSAGGPFRDLDFKKTQLFHLAGLGQWRWPPFCLGNNWFEADNGKRGSKARKAEVSASPLISLSVSAARGKRVYLFCQTPQVQVHQPFQ